MVFLLISVFMCSSYFNFYCVFVFKQFTFRPRIVGSHCFISSDNFCLLFGVSRQVIINVNIDMIWLKVPFNYIVLLVTFVTHFLIFCFFWVYRTVFMISFYFHYYLFSYSTLLFFKFSSYYFSAALGFRMCIFHLSQSTIGCPATLRVVLQMHASTSFLCPLCSWYIFYFCFCYKHCNIFS